jgi:hypothetical protein
LLILLADAGHSRSFLLLRKRHHQAMCWEPSTRGELKFMRQVPTRTFVYGAVAPDVAFEESMSALERTTYRGSQGSNALTLEHPRSDSQDVPHGSESSTDFTLDDSIPLRLSDLREPDPREFASFAASQRTSILWWIIGLAVSMIAILAAALSSDVRSTLIDKSKIFVGGAIGDRSATNAAGANMDAPRSEANAVAIAEDIVSADHTALHSDVSAAQIGTNEAAAPPRDTRSITADPVKARDWYRKAASFGSAKAQQRLIQIQN